MLKMDTVMQEGNILQQQVLRCEYILERNPKRVKERKGVQKQRKKNEKGRSKER